MLRKRYGFSLIELLVVIAIIAILAAILFPIFMAAKSRSKLTFCSNNLKQWSTALQSYMSDNNDRFPAAGACKLTPHNKLNGGTATVYQALWKYMGKAENVKWCPAINQKQYSPENGWSYWYYCPHNNWHVSNYNGGKGALCGYSMSDVARPSKKPVFTEAWSQHEAKGGLGERFFYPVIYCDGHVQVQVIGFATSTDLTQLVEKLYVGRDGSVSKY